MYTTYYYACLKHKDGYIEKKRFTSREEARNYISNNFNELKHTQCWTE